MSRRCLRILCGGKDEASDDGPTRTGQTSALHACVSIIKCVVGAGSFFLPYGLKKAGLWGGAIGILVLGLLCDYIDYRVIQCKRKLFGGRTIAYPDLAEATFGLWVRRMSYVFLLIQGLGACAVYVVFCGDLLHAIADRLTVLEWVLIIGAIEVLLSWIKSFSYVGLTSVAGDAALVLGVVVVFVYGFKDGGFIDSPLNMPVIRIETYPQFFGTAAFLFSITMYLFPIESSMREPKRFNASLHIAFFITTIGNVVFASFAYMFFGDDVQQIVIDNLGQSVSVTIAKVALVLDLVFTFVIVFVPCRTVVEESILGRAGLWHWWRVGRFEPSPSSSLVSSPSLSTTSSTLFVSTPRSSPAASLTSSSSPSTSLASSSGRVDSAGYLLPPGAYVRLGSADSGGIGGGGVGSINYSTQQDHFVTSEDRGLGLGLVDDGAEPREEEADDLVPHWERVLVRTGMIAAIVGLACAIPNVIDLVGLIVGISNSMNSFVLPTLIYMRVRYREKNEGFVSVYDLKEQRDEDARRERREKRKRDAAKTAKKKRQQRRQNDDAVDDGGGGDDGRGLDEEGGGADVKGERRGLFSGRRPAYGIDSNGDAEGDGDSAGPSGNGDGDDDGGDSDSEGEGGDGGRGQQQYRAREDSEAKRDSGTKWLLWMQQTSQGRRGNERRSGVRYWVREAAHWAFHSLIVVFGLAMGVLTTVQAFQTVIADYS